MSTCAAFTGVNQKRTSTTDMECAPDKIIQYSQASSRVGRSGQSSLATLYVTHAQLTGKATPVLDSHMLKYCTTEGCLHEAITSPFLNGGGGISDCIKLPGSPGMCNSMCSNCLMVIMNAVFINDKMNLFKDTRDKHIVQTYNLDKVSPKIIFKANSILSKKKTLCSKPLPAGFAQSTSNALRAVITSSLLSEKTNNPDYRFIPIFLTFDKELIEKISRTKSSFETVDQLRVFITKFKCDRLNLLKKPIFLDSIYNTVKQFFLDSNLDFRKSEDFLSKWASNSSNRNSTTPQKSKKPSTRKASPEWNEITGGLNFYTPERDKNLTFLNKFAVDNSRVKDFKKLLKGGKIKAFIEICQSCPTLSAKYMVSSTSFSNDDEFDGVGDDNDSSAGEPNTAISTVTDT